MGRPCTFRLAPLLLVLLPGAGAAGTDLRDIALLAGHTDVFVNLTSDALAELGWETGVTVNFNNALDQALTFYKNGTCLVTFSAVNDPTDLAQVLGGIPPHIPLCGHDVHQGIGSELLSFMNDPGFSRVVEFMNQARCTEAISAGASMGGSVAGLFAACASRGEAGFGARTSYRLVTFGSPPCTTTPLTNAASPSGIFEGTRYAITESDGGASVTAGLRSDPRAFRLDGLQVLHDFAMAKNMTGEAAQVSAVLAMLNSTGAAEFESAYLSVEPSLSLLWLLLLSDVMQDPSAPPSQLVMAWAMPLVPMGLFSFEYDPVPVSMYPLGFRHPLVDFQPLPNPLVAGRSSMDMVPAGPEVADLPRGDFVQSGFGIMLSNGWFPNHNMCCYTHVGEGECPQKYGMGPGGEPWRVCSNALLAYLPPAAQSYTCGDVKRMYKEGGCCGNPARPFAFPAPGPPAAHDFTCGEIRRLFKASGCCGNPGAPFHLP